jgi:hypothetical protein
LTTFTYEVGKLTVNTTIHSNGDHAHASFE